MAPLGVHEEDRVEDLHGAVRVEGRDDLRDRVEVAVQKRAQAGHVLHGTASGAAGDEELEGREAEGVLAVDADEANAAFVLIGWGHAMVPGPRLRLTGACLVRHRPDLADPLRIEVRGDWKRHPAETSFRAPVSFALV